MIQVWMNSWFNAKRACQWAISPRIKFMMMITIANNVGLNYTSSFSSGTIMFSSISLFLNLSFRQFIFQETGQATSSGFCGVIMALARSRQLKSLPFPLLSTATVPLVRTPVHFEVIPLLLLLVQSLPSPSLPRLRPPYRSQQSKLALCAPSFTPSSLSLVASLFLNISNKLFGIML